MSNEGELKNGEGEKSSFWKTLPGILTGAAALITAVGGLLAATGNFGGKEACPNGGIGIDSALSQPISESGQLTICDGKAYFSLHFTAVSAARKQVDLLVAIPGRSPRPVTLDFQKPRELFDGTQRYEAEVIDIADWVQGNDTALLSVRRQ